MFCNIYVRTKRVKTHWLYKIGFAQNKNYSARGRLAPPARDFSKYRDFFTFLIVFPLLRSSSETLSEGFSCIHPQKIVRSLRSRSISRFFRVFAQKCNENRCPKQVETWNWKYKQGGPLGKSTSGARPPGIRGEDLFFSPHFGRPNKFCHPPAEGLRTGLQTL